MAGNPYLEHDYFSSKETLSRDNVFLGTQSIISANDQVREHRYSFAKHIHKSIEIYLITSGCCLMDIHIEKVACQAGDFVLITPNTVHSLYLETEEACTFHHIHFNPEPFYNWYLNTEESCPLNLLNALIFSCDTHFKLKADQKINSLILNIIEETERGGISSNALINLYLAELMLYLIRASDSDLPTLTDMSTHTPEHIRYVSYALSYIHENFSQKILIQDIASHLNISSRYLSKIFFQHMNLTILNYINIHRINQAMDLMLDTGLTLTDISEKVGLKDSQHFSKLFRSIIGLSPNRYRKLILHDLSEESS